MTTIKRFALALALSTALASAPAMAEVPTRDSTAISELKKILENVTKQLEEQKKTTTASEAIQKATGSQGTGSGSGGGIMDMLKGTGLDKVISGAQSLMNGQGGNALGGAMGMMQGISQIMNTAKSFSGGNNSGGGNNVMSQAMNVMNQVMNGNSQLGNMQKALQSILYVANSTAPTSQNIESVNDMRKMNLQNAVTSGLAIAMQVKNALGGGGESGALKQLASAAQNSQNLRGDIAANTSALLKLAEQTVAQNGLLAAQLHINSAWMIANDGVNGRDIGGQQ